MDLIIRTYLMMDAFNFFSKLHCSKFKQLEATVVIWRYINKIELNCSAFQTSLCILYASCQGSTDTSAL